MKMSKRILLSLTVIGSSLFLHENPALAAGWVTSPELTYSQNVITSNTDKNAQQTQETINTAANTIVAALQEVSKQNTSNTVGFENAMANMKDTEDQRKVAMEVQREKLAATNAATSGASICNTITGAAATQHLEDLARVWRTNAVQATLARNQGMLPGSNAMANATQLEHIYNANHCASNATAEDVALKRCSSVTQPTTMTSADQNGSKTAADDQNAELFLNNETLNDTQSDAMGRFMTLTVDGHAPGQVAGPNVTNSADKEKLFYEMDSLRALRSIASSVMSGLISQAKIVKTAGGETQSMATSWANATAGQVAGYQAGSSGSIYPDGISELAADALKSKYWYYNINYQVYASSEGQAQAAKDLNEMVAWNTVLNYKKYKQLREMNATLASILAIMIDERQEKVLSR